VVEETFVPGASVAVIARAHGVNANQVFHWRKLYREGRLGVKPASTELVPVRIADEGCVVPARQTGAIHIELGNARIRIEGAVDATTIRTVVEILRR
jgi:transposase